MQAANQCKLFTDITKSHMQKVRHLLLDILQYVSYLYIFILQVIAWAQKWKIYDKTTRGEESIFEILFERNVDYLF